MLPDTRNFRQFPTWLQEHDDLIKEREVYMYCTGGIRCEKASVLVGMLGAKAVYQLHGSEPAHPQVVFTSIWTAWVVMSRSLKARTSFLTSALRRRDRHQQDLRVKSASKTAQWPAAQSAAFLF